MALLVSFGIFATITGVLLSVYYALTYESPITQRLRQLTPDSADARRKAATPRSSRWRQLVAGFGQFGFGRTDGSLERTMSAADALLGKEDRTAR